MPKKHKKTSRGRSYSTILRVNHMARSDDDAAKGAQELADLLKKEKGVVGVVVSEVTQPNVDSEDSEQEDSLDDI